MTPPAKQGIIETRIKREHSRIRKQVFSVKSHLRSLEDQGSRLVAEYRLVSSKRNRFDLDLVNAVPRKKHYESDAEALLMVRVMTMVAMSRNLADEFDVLIAKASRES